MSKTLIVSYIPRHESSTTKVLLDHFEELISKKDGQVEVLDLLKNVPDFFLEKNLAAYYTRNYGGQTLSKDATLSIAKMDTMTAQLLTADRVVIATPVYNFSFPAVVKAYIDSVMQRGVTFGRADGVNANAAKKALLITTSAGVYSTEKQNLDWEHTASLAKVIFTYAGYGEFMAVTAGGVNGSEEDKQASLAKAKAELEQVVEKW